MTKTSVKALLLTAVISLVLPLATLANVKDDRVFIKVAPDQTIDGNYYAVGTNISMEGHVTGDLICAAESVEVKGEVDGDVICAAQTLIISGKIHGSVRSIGSVVSVENVVDRNLMIASGDLIIGPKAQIGMDTLFWSARVNHLGSINGSMRGRAYQVFMAGKVSENVNFIFEDLYADRYYKPLVMQERARIGGNLNYRSSFDASFASRKSIMGKVTKEESNTAGALAMTIAKIWIWSRIIAIFGALLIGLFLVKAWRKPVMALCDMMVAQPFPSIGWGAFVTSLVPLLAFFLAMTIIGLPVSFILMSFWLGAIMLAKPVAAIMFGYVMMGRYKHKISNRKARKEIDAMNPTYVMALGVIVTYAFMSIPLIGFLVSVLLTSWVIGAAWLLVKDLRQAEAK